MWSQNEKRRHVQNSGILRDKTMADNLMYIPKDNNKISLLYSLDTQLNEPTDQNGIKVPKVDNE